MGSGARDLSWVAEFDHNSANFSARSLRPFVRIGDGRPLSGRLHQVYSATMDVPHYWTAEQVQRLLHQLAEQHRHQARTAALIMWRTGLRVSEVIELEWRDLDYAGEPATVLVRRSKTRRARTVRMHGELVQLFTNWPASRVPRSKVVAISMRTVLRHIADANVSVQITKREVEHCSWIKSRRMCRRSSTPRPNWE